MKKAIQLKDFLTYHYLSNVQASPDGTTLACVVAQANENDNTYTSTLALLSEKKVLPLTGYGKERMYVWEDNTHILFASLRDKADIEAAQNGEERTCFYRISTQGGEAQKAFTLPLTVTSIQKLDDTRFVFTANYDLHYSSIYQSDDAEKQRLLKAKKENADYEVFDELPFYGNGAGFINKTRNSLFMYDCKNEAITRISEENFQVGGYAIDEKKEKLYYFGEAYVQKPKNKDTVCVYDFKRQVTHVLLPAKEYAIRFLAEWQGELLVVASTQREYGMNENAKFYLLDKASGEMKLFADYEDAIGSSVGSDCRYGGGKSIKVWKDAVYFISTLTHRSVLRRLDAQGIISTVYEGSGSVDDFDVTKDKLFFVGMQEGKLQECYCCDLLGNDVRQLSTWNEEIFVDKDVRPYVELAFENDGVSLCGWVLEPKDYDPKKTYPAILDIHGGPKTVYGKVFYHEMQLWANMGYFVFFMNPRGGDGYGNRFADLRGAYGTFDYEDLMKFTDCVLEKYPAIDQQRVGDTGGSYGGFMTNWIIGHTNRFAAAASQRSISNWISFAYTSDIGNFFALDQQGGNIWEDHEKLWWHSPLKYAQNVKTPTLFIHSDEDYRCPLSEGYQMYSALCDLGIETRMCMFHGENHELSRSGKPRHRVRRLEEITNLFEKHLK